MNDFLELIEYTEIHDLIRYTEEHCSTHWVLQRTEYDSYIFYPFGVYEDTIDSKTIAGLLKKIQKKYGK